MKEAINELEQAVIPLMDEYDEYTELSFKKFEDLRNWLIEQVAYLIDRDFEHLLRVLYLIDVSEKKVRLLLEQNEGENASSIIADLILERQAEKIESRKKYVPKDGKYFSDD